MGDTFSQEEFNKFILDEGIVGLFKEPKKLKSDRVSNWYVNWRNVTEDVYRANQLANFIVGFVEDQGLNPKCFYGVPEGATKAAVLTQYKWAISREDFGPGAYPLPMGRGKKKEHGDEKDADFLGLPREGTIILEDVTTTGGSLFGAIADVEELGTAEIIGAIGFTNRMEITPVPGVDTEKIVKKFGAIYERATGQQYDHAMSVEAAVKAAGVPYFSMSNGLELLPRVYQKANPGVDVARAIEEEFGKFGVDRLKLIQENGNSTD